MASTVDGERDLFDDDDGAGDDSEFDTDGDDDPRHAKAPSSAAAPSSVPIFSFPTVAPFQSPNPSPDPLLHPALTGAVHPFPYLLYPAAAPSTNRKRQRIRTAVAAAAAEEESRRVVQKLWKDEDEIAILQGFLDFTTQRGTTHADYQYDTGPFFDQICTRLQIDYNRNQLVEKLRRLKRKYRNAAARIASGKEPVFKSEHDRATYEISQKIWSSSFKRVRKRRSSGAAPDAQSAEPYINGAAPEIAPQIVKQEAAAVAVPVEVTAEATPAVLPPVAVPVEVTAEATPTVLPPMTVPVEVTAEATPAVLPSVAPAPAPVTSSGEESVKNSLSPLFKELIQCVAGGLGGIAGGALALGSPLQLNIPWLGQPAAMEERWKQQQILELEVLLKRTELMKEQIKAALKELKLPVVAEERSS